MPETPMIDPVSTSPVARPEIPAALRRTAEALEAAFLSEMLAHAGLGAVSDTFGGGIGEGQFASLLRDEQAAALVRRGGIGLAEQIVKSLMARQHAGL
ncbi:MAG: rod-binding protein [Gemmobacter sp.]